MVLGNTLIHRVTSLDARVVSESARENSCLGSTEALRANI